MITLYCRGVTIQPCLVIILSTHLSTGTLHRIKVLAHQASSWCLTSTLCPIEMAQIQRPHPFASNTRMVGDHEQWQQSCLIMESTTIVALKVTQNERWTWWNGRGVAGAARQRIVALILTVFAQTKSKFIGTKRKEE